HHCRLGIDREVELLGRPLLEQRRELGAKDALRFLERFMHAGNAGVALQHADGLRALSGQNQREFHSVASDEPQVKPPPTPCISTRWPGRMRPPRTYSSSASGTEAAEVLPWWSTVTTSLCAGSLSLRATASRIRTLAWCGISQSISAMVMPAATT